MAKGSRALRYQSAAEMPPGMQRLVAAADAATPRGYRPTASTSSSGDVAGKVARGRVQHVAGEMNKTEAAYAEHLQAELRAGRVLWFVFESVKLRLAKSTHLTVDFFVLTAAGELEAHEVKGHWEEDARVKIKVAAAQYPFRFLAVQRDGARWKTEVFE